LNLHIPTVYLFSALALGSVTLGMALLAWRDRSAYLREWAWALLLAMLGLYLMSQQARLHVGLGVFLANLLLLGGLALLCAGYARLFEQTVPWRTLAAVLGLEAVAFFVLTFLASMMVARVFAFSAALVVLSALAARMLWRQRHRLSWAALAIPLSLHSLLTLVGVLRIAWALSQGVRSTNMPTAGSPDGLLIMVGAIAGLALAQSLLAMHAARLLETLESQASTDALTGLLNRRGFDAVLDREWRRHQRLDKPMSVMMIDIDHFKQVNDQHGHAMGDAALRHLGRVLREHLRPYDVCARLGGEEFCILLPDVALDVACQTAERLRQSNWTFGTNAQGEPLRFTVSIGLAASSVGGAASALAAADQALYKAKALGRNRVEMSI
jgi:diguanylate cyclase (GGDEF)-like protein